ncbi:MAG: tetratricopeptide repeat protein [Bacteroidales bacterium]|nr:tetratricopeptide repeat protein [Bacteroidales bacterium]
MSIVTCFSQDIPPAKPPSLPFQQDAPQAGNEEQLAMQYYQNHDYDKAAELYERIYTLKPNSYYYQLLIICWVETNEFGKAERLVKRLQKAEPGTIRYDVDLGYLYYREGNAEKSKKIYEDAIKKLSSNQQQIFNLANAFMSRGEYAYCIRTYQRGRELMNNSYPFGFELAGVYEQMGDFSNAMEEYLNLLSFNKDYLNTVQDRIQMILSYDINSEKNEVLRKILLSRVQKEPDKIYFSELLWWYSIQQKDFDLAFIQAKALDRRLKENGDRLIQLASLAASNEKFDVALQCYQYIVAKGTSNPYFEYSRRELINIRYHMLLSEPVPAKKQLEEVEKELDRTWGTENHDPQNISMVRNLAHLDAFYLEKPQIAVELLEQAIDIPGLSDTERANCKLELADILLFTDDVWEATLLYQQVYKQFPNDVLGQEAKFKNTKLTFYIGEFKWAKAQADVLKAATSKFISNDAIALSLLISENLDPDSNTVALGLYARAELLDYRNQMNRALQTLDSIPMLFGEHPILQQVLYKKGEIMRKQGKFAESDSLFQLVISGYPDGILADEALMQSATLNEKQLNDPVRAQQLYQTLLDKYPGSIFIPEARKEFRRLRGDKIQ